MVFFVQKDPVKSKMGKSERMKDKMNALKYIQGVPRNMKVVEQF